MLNRIDLAGKRVRKTRMVHTERFIVVVEVDAVVPDADPSEPCFEPHTVELLREVEAHARNGDLDRLKQHGKVYVAVDAA